jgi:hypothetical protein
MASGTFHKVAVDTNCSLDVLRSIPEYHEARLLPAQCFATPPQAQRSHYGSYKEAAFSIPAVKLISRLPHSCHHAALHTEGCFTPGMTHRRQQQQQQQVVLGRQMTCMQTKTVHGWTTMPQDLLRHT